MRPNPVNLSTRAALAGLLVAAASAACAPPTVYDTELRPVRDPIILASVGNGWLAVDSTANGVRAVLEIQVEGSEAAADYVSLHVPRLHCSASGEHLPARVRTEAPRCPIPPQARPECTGGSAGACRAARVLVTPSCLYTIRAEFLFDRVPHLDASHYLTFGQSETPVVWAKSP